MNPFTSAFSLNDADLAQLRTRSFELGGHTFKVKVPLLAEMRAMHQALENIPPEMIDACLKEAVESDDKLSEATTRAKTKLMVLETFKFLIPEQEGFDMRTISYDMIEEEFPFPIQLMIMKKISECIGFDYDETKKN